MGVGVYKGREVSKLKASKEGDRGMNELSDYVASEKRKENEPLHTRIADLESQLAEKDKELSDAQWQLAEERRASMKKDKEIAIAVKQLREMGLVGIPDRLEQALKGGDE